MKTMIIEQRNRTKKKPIEGQRNSHRTQETVGKFSWHWQWQWRFLHGIFNQIFPGSEWRRKIMFPQNSKVAKYEEINYEMADKFFFILIETRKCSNMSQNVVISAENEKKWYKRGFGQCPFFRNFHGRPQLFILFPDAQ